MLFWKREFFSMSFLYLILCSCLLCVRWGIRLSFFVILLFCFIFFCFIFVFLSFMSVIMLIFLFLNVLLWVFLVVLLLCIWMRIRMRWCVFCGVWGRILVWWVWVMCGIFFVLLGCFLLFLLRRSFFIIVGCIGILLCCCIRVSMRGLLMFCFGSGVGWCGLCWMVLRGFIMVKSGGVILLVGFCFSGWLDVGVCFWMVCLCMLFLILWLGVGCWLWISVSIGDWK